MRHIYLTALSALALLVFIAPTASAQELDANGQKLKTAFQSMIDDFKTQYSAPDGMSIRTDGAVNVEKAEKYYAITLPFITIAHSDGSKFELGMIGINAAPHDVAGQWKMTYALPAQMRALDADGQEALTVEIGGQRSSGVWDENLKYFAKLDSNFQSITTTSPATGAVFKAGSARIVYDLVMDAQGLWSGPTYMTLQDVSGSSPLVAGDFLNIKKIGVNSEMFQYNPAIVDDYMKKIEAIAAPDPTTGEIPVLTPAQGKELATMFLHLLGDGFTSQYSMEGFSLKTTENVPTPFTVTMDKAALGFDITGLKAQDAVMKLRLGYDNLAGLPAQAGLPELIPSQVNLDLALTKIPVGDLIELASNTFASTAGTTQMGGMAAMSMAFKLPAILAKSGTTLNIDRNFYGNALYHVDLNGKVVSNLTAAHSATADVNAKIRGLDAVMNVLGQQATDPQAPNYQTIQQALASLTILRGFGKPGTDEKGATLHTYDIKLDEKGQFLINGQDMSMLMGMMNGGAGAGAKGGAGAAPVPQAMPAVPPAAVE